MHRQKQCHAISRSVICYEKVTFADGCDAPGCRSFVVSPQRELRDSSTTVQKLGRRLFTRPSEPRVAKILAQTRLRVARGWCISERTMFLLAFKFHQRFNVDLKQRPESLDGKASAKGCVLRRGTGVHSFLRKVTERLVFQFAAISCFATVRTSQSRSPRNRICGI